MNNSVHFTEGGTGITNFSIEDLQAYQLAVQIGNKQLKHQLFIINKPMLGSPTYMTGCSLHSYDRNDKSMFWCIYRQVQADLNKQNEKDSSTNNL